MTSQVISKFELPTVNRGIKTFIVSFNGKHYFTHELGRKTQWAKAFDTEDVHAHRCNPSVKRGNQYGRYWRVKGMKQFEDAVLLAEKQANKNVIYV